MRKPNYRFLAKVFGGVAVFCLCTFFVHGYQVKRNASALLLQAEQAQKDGRLERAATFLSQYLGMRPTDADALGQYGQLLSDPRLAKNARDAFRAKMILDRALYFDPERHDLRRVSIRIAVSLGLSANAREDLDRLRQVFPNDGELDLMSARCYEHTGALLNARSAYEESIKHAPDRIDTYVKLAGLLRQKAKDVLRDKETVADVCKRADDVVNAMVLANSSSYQAYLYRAEYTRLYLAAKDPKAAATVTQDVARARELNPDAAEVTMMAATLAMDRGAIDEARQWFRRGCERNPNEARLYSEWARLEEKAGQPDAAIGVVRKGLVNLTSNSELLWQLAELLTKEGRKDEVNESLAKLKRVGVPASDCDVLQARLLMKEQKWPEAALLLEKSVGSLVGRKGSANDPFTTQLTQQAGLSLGECYEQMGDFDRALAAFGRVVTRDSRSISGSLGQGRALEAMGRYGEAFDHYRHLVRVAGAPQALWVEIARLALIRNLEREESRRDWSEVEGALKIAEELKPLPVEVVVLRAECLAARGEADKARDHVLKNYADPTDRPVKAWVSLVGIAERQSNYDAATALLDEADRRHKDSVDLRLARAQLLVRQNPEAAGIVIGRLVEGCEELAMNERRRLLNGLALLAMQSGDRAVASQLWGRLADAYPNDLHYSQVLFDVAVQMKDDEAMQMQIGHMRRIEGDGGTMWRFATAAMLVGRAARGDKSGLSEARSQLAVVATRRPNWPRAELCLAQIEELSGNTDTALAGYLGAIERGERDPHVMRRAIELLQQQRRFAEAYDLFRRVPNPKLLNPDFNRLGAEVALSANNIQAAQSLAEAAVANGSTDYRDHLWLARLYFAMGEKAKSVSAAEQARNLAPDKPETWVSLVQSLAATKQKDRALTEIVAAKNRLSGTGAALALATCYEVVGQMDQAAQSYAAAIAASPDDPAVLRGISEYYVRLGQMQKAIPHLQRLGIDLKTKQPAAAAWARQTLAFVMALQGDPAQTSKALGMLAADEKAAPPGADLSPIERTRATILALQSANRQRQEAVQILERLIARRVALPQDYFTAAQLYEALGKWPLARRLYVTLLNIPGADTSAHLSSYSRSLIRHNEPEEAQRYVELLAAREATSWTVLELRTRLLHARGKSAQAVKELQEYVSANEDRTLVVAGLLAEFDAHNAAEELYRRHANKPGHPSNALTLAQYLFSRKKYAEALDICDRAWSVNPDMVVVEFAVAVLSQMPADAPQFSRVERRIKASLDKSPDNVDLVVAMANLRNFQGRYDDAVQLYREALAKNPRHSTALNNIAWITALRGGNVVEAVDLVRRAADVIGADPGLLDTRGVVYLALKQTRATEQAVRDFEEAITETPNPSTYFHLAQAYDAAGRRKDALNTWQKAKQLGLAATSLHPLERPAFERLARQFN